MIPPKTSILRNIPPIKSPINPAAPETASAKPK